MSFEKQAQFLSDGELHAIYRACESEIRKTVEYVTFRQELAQQGQDRIPVAPTSGDAYADLGTCLAAVTQVFSNSPWDFKALHQTRPLLHAAVNVVHGGPLALRTVLYPDARHLVPFVVLFALWTQHSPEVLFGSNLQDYELVERFGQAMFVARAQQSPTGKGKIVRLPFDETLHHPAAMFTFLQKWTGLARRFAPPEIKSRMFLFMPRTEPAKVKSFDQAVGTWFRYLESFRCEYNLPAFSLTQIRRTMVEIEKRKNKQTFDLVADSLWNSSPTTTEAYYADDRATTLGWCCCEGAPFVAPIRSALCFQCPFALFTPGWRDLSETIERACRSASSNYVDPDDPFDTHKK